MSSSRLSPRHPQAAQTESAGITRRHILSAASAALATSSLSLTSFGAGAQQTNATPPTGAGQPGRKLLLRGGMVLSMDSAVGDFPQGDVLIEGKQIVAVGPRIEAGDAAVVDATNRVVMPGFVDTHYHQYQTALRSQLSDGLLANYMADMMGKLTPVFRPQDVHIAVLLASLDQIDGGVTTVVDTSQISHSPEHSDACIAALKEVSRRALFAYSSGVGPNAKYPGDLQRLKSQYFASDDQLLSLALAVEFGGAAALNNYKLARDDFKLARDMGTPLTSHVLGQFGADAAIRNFGEKNLLGPDNLLVHCTRLTDVGWKYIADSGAKVSITPSIEMMMRHGMPPIQKAIDLGIRPALGSDIESTMIADFFHHMRAVLTLQRAFANEQALNKEQAVPTLLTPRDAIRMATLDGARVAHLDHKVGSLTPGKEADIILLRADAMNVAPINNVPGAVVTLMDRSNVDTVLVAGKVLKWRGSMQNVDTARILRDIDSSREYLLSKSGVTRKLF